MRIPTVTAENAEWIRKAVRERESGAFGGPGQQQFRGVNRLEIHVVGGLAHEVECLSEPGGIMKVDEPPDRGGTATGPSPLLHFLAGVGTCLLTQFLRVSIAEGYNLRYTGAKVRGEYTRCMGGVYESIVCDVRAEGVLSEADAERLAERAEAHCIAHSTLKKVIKITTVFHLNGQEVVRRVS